MPLVIASQQSGLFQTVLGAALTAAGVFATSLTLGTSTFPISAGASMMLGGVMQMLSPHPKGLKGREAPENAPS
ncbi:tail assembly protein, partial [Pseudomonas aeruginosa]|nr:tail assembly protein [Pseudomonas aeruginosa]